MGTNYYARYNECKCCNRYDEIHIGKSSAGWTFTFHATDDIKSFKDWALFLQNSGVKIFDEYGDEKSFSQFLQLVDGKKYNPLNHAKENKEGGSIWIQMAIV
jgi:hypothetical protein